MDRIDEMKVECKDCPFTEIVAVDGETLPAEVAIEHGREYEHTLSVTSLD